MTRRLLAALALSGSILIAISGATASTEADAAGEERLAERYRQALAADSGNLTLHYLLGIALLQAEQNAAAMSELQIAYPAYYDSIEAHYNLAVAALRLGDLDSTEIFLEQAERLGAAEMPATYPISGLYFNLALSYLEADNANEAIRLFHKVLRLDPDRHEVHRQLGDLYAQRGDTDLAIQAFHRYIDFFPEDQLSRDYLFALEFNRAQEFLASGDLVSADKGFSAALEFHPGSPTALYFLGYIAYSNGDQARTASLLEQAYPEADDSLQQSLRPLLYNNALALRNGRKLQAALDAVSLLAERSDASFDELLLAGTLNLDLGRHRAAMALLQRATKLNPAHSAAQQNLIRSEHGAFLEWLSETKQHLATKQLNQASRALSEAEKLQPQNVRATSLRHRIEQSRLELASSHFFKARTARDAGDLRRAFTEVNQGLTLLPEDHDGLSLREEITKALSATLKEQLSAAEKHLQNESWEDAKQAFGEILLIDPTNANAKSGLETLQQLKRAKASQFLQQGQQAVDAGQIEQAADSFTQALQLHPTLTEASAGLAMVEELRSNLREEFMTKGRLALERKEFKTARKWFLKAKEGADNPQAEQELADLEQQMAQTAEELATEAEQAVIKGELKSADKLFARALELVPGHLRAQAGKEQLVRQKNASLAKRLEQGVAALRQGDYATAAKAYRAILEVSPDNHQALEGLSQSREQQANKLKQLIAQSEAALGEGDLDLAEEHLDSILELDPFHQQAQSLRQRLESVRLAGAQKGDEQKLYLQGVAHYTQGRYAEAIKSWETVLLLDPEHEKSQQNITKTQRKLRQIEEYRGG